MGYNGQKQAYLAAIEATLPLATAPERPAALAEAMEYSLLAPGKRARALLLLGVYRGLATDDHLDATAFSFASALECIHAYSLIHDDLPAMDDDDFRRGRLSNHRRFGEALAVLAGDGLLNEAFERMSVCVVKAECWEDAQKTAKALAVIAAAAGSRGMVGGQAEDMAAENRTITQDVLDSVHEKKTAALIAAALEAGVLLGGGNPSQAALARQAGRKLGIAFQIQDDVLDVTANFTELGKPTKSDEKNSKVTYVSLHGLEPARREAAALYAEVRAGLAGMPLQDDFLAMFVDELSARRK